MKLDEKTGLEYVDKQKSLGWSDEQLLQGLGQMGWNKEQSGLILTKYKLTETINKSMGILEKNKNFRFKLVIVCAFFTLLIYLFFLYFPKG